MDLEGGDTVVNIKNRERAEFIQAQWRKGEVWYEVVTIEERRTALWLSTDVKREDPG
jgi:hypothetical protein